MADSRALLLACLKQEAEEEKIKILNALSEEEWEALIKEASRHGLVPFIFNSLKPYYPDQQIPLHYQERLRSGYYASAARNMRFYHQLGEVVKLFNAEGIPVILLKGAHLAKYVYGNIALRPMVDIDLLVKKGDLAKVQSLLTEDGYKTSEEETWFKTEKKHLPPFCKDGFILEVHAYIANPPILERVDMNSLWNRAEKATLEETEVLLLSPEDLFLHLCLHTCIQHNLENGLIACLDTACILKRYDKEMNWQRLWKEASFLGVERAVYLMLALTEKIMSTPMPEQISSAVQTDLETVSALKSAQELIFEQYTGIPRNISPLFAKKSWREKCSLLWQRVFLTKEFAAKARQNEMAMLSFKRCSFYFNRLRSLLKNHRRTVLQGMRKDPQTVSALEIQKGRNILRE